MAGRLGDLVAVGGEVLQVEGDRFVHLRDALLDRLAGADAAEESGDHAVAAIKSEPPGQVIDWL